jgi:3-hydroxyisobutyrate dehydrogenase
MTRVGFIGLGSQGAPMARRVVEAGFPLTIWARRSASVDPFRDTNAQVASSPAELAAASDIVEICVVTDVDVEDVLLGSDGVLAGLSPGGLVAIHSTVHPDTCIHLAKRAAEGGVGLIDAPVSGGGDVAASGQLLVMAGGDEELVERCRPVFETFAHPMLHLGGVGSGQAAKLLNNLVFTAQIAVALDTFSFGDRLGVDRLALSEVLAHGSGGSRAAAIVANSGFDLSGLRGAARLLEKDVTIVLDVAQARDAADPSVLTDLARSTLATLAADDELA